MPQSSSHEFKASAALEPNPSTPHVRRGLQRSSTCVGKNMTDQVIPPTPTPDTARMPVLSPMNMSAFGQPTAAASLRSRLHHQPDKESAVTPKETVISLYAAFGSGD